MPKAEREKRAPLDLNVEADRSQLYKEVADLFRLISIRSAQNNRPPDLPIVRYNGKKYLVRDVQTESSPFGEPEWRSGSNDINRNNRRRFKVDLIDKYIVPAVDFELDSAEVTRTNERSGSSHTSLIRVNGVKATVFKGVNADDDVLGFVLGVLGELRTALDQEGADGSQVATLTNRMRANVAAQCNWGTGVVPPAPVRHGSGPH